MKISLKIIVIASTVFVILSMIEWLYIGMDTNFGIKELFIDGKLSCVFAIIIGWVYYLFD